MTSPFVPMPPAGAALEAQLRALLGDSLQEQLSAAAATPPARGRPQILPAAVLWLGILVGILQGITTQRGVWRLLSVHGLWSLPAFPVVDQAFYNRLQRTDAASWAEVFRLVTTALTARLLPQTAQHLAPFAPRVVALDHTVLDAVLRKIPGLRELRPGDLALIPGTLACAFDVRLQLWLEVSYQEVVRDPWEDFTALLRTLEPGTLLLTDLGFFSFEWFDRLTQDGYHFVSRLRRRVTYKPLHLFYEIANQARGAHRVTVSDRLVFLGTYRANQMGQPVRLIEVCFGTATHRYVTNVLDPQVLPACQVVALYGRRWDIESGFQLVKTYLGLAGLWSGHRAVLLHQVFATFIIAQIILGFRNELAATAQCDLQEVSVRLLVEWIPRLAQQGHDPLTEMVRTGRQAGYIRPFRGRARPVPEPHPDAIIPPLDVGARPPRYPNREAYLRRQRALRAEKRERGDSTYRPYGRQS